MANANQVIVNGETILDLRSDTLTPETLQKGYTAHDKSGTKITGTLEASSPGGAKETWVLNSTVDPSSTVIFNVDFTSNGLSFSSIVLSTNLRVQISYDSTTVKMLGNWASEAYRKLTFDTPPTGDLLTWLQANGVKQPDNTAVQDSKALTITSNGTVSVTPDAPYDALKKVDVTVDVISNAPLVTVTFKATKFGDEVNFPDEDAISEMRRMVISAFVNGNISVSTMYDFSQQWGSMSFPFDVAVPQDSSVTICNNSSMGGGVTATNALVAKCTNIEGIREVATVYNITDGTTITMDLA